MSGVKKGTPVKAPGKQNPHIVVLDADPAILDYVKGVLEDRFRVTTPLRGRGTQNNP